MEYVETTTECQMKHEMMATILIMKAELMIDQVKLMDGIDQEEVQQQKIIEQNNVVMAILLYTRTVKMETQLIMMGVV